MNIKTLLKSLNKHGLMKSIKISGSKVLRNIQTWRLRYLVQKDNFVSRLFVDSDLSTRNNKIMQLPELAFRTNILSIKEKISYNSEVGRIIEEANLVCENKFNILGSGWMNWEQLGRN